MIFYKKESAMRAKILFFCLVILLISFNILSYAQGDFASSKEMSQWANQLREGAKKDIIGYPLYLVIGAIVFYLIIKYMLK